MNQYIQDNNEEQAAPVQETAKQKLPVAVHFMCGWPLLMILFGGAIGGGLGGLAYGVNLGIYKSSLPAFAKFFLNLLVGCVAIVIWFAIAMVIFVNQEA